MKKRIVRIAFFSAIILAIVSPKSLIGQALRVGGGLASGSGYKYHQVRTGIPGIFVRGSYDFTEKLSVATGISVFLPNHDEPEEGERKSGLWMVDLDAHYVFANKAAKFSFFGLAGLDISLLSSKYLGNELYPDDFSDNYMGLNIGLGSIYQFNAKTDLFAEIKFIAGKFHQLQLSAGILIRIENLFPKKE